MARQTDEGSLDASTTSLVGLSELYSSSPEVATAGTSNSPEASTKSPVVSTKPSSPVVACCSRLVRLVTASEELAVDLFSIPQVLLEDLLQTDLLDVGHPGGHVDDVPREGAVPRVPGSSGGKVVGSVRLQQDPVQARLLHDSAGPSTPR